jgi:hypothetical protein
MPRECFLSEKCLTLDFISSGAANSMLSMFVPNRVPILWGGQEVDRVRMRGDPWKFLWWNVSRPYLRDQAGSEFNPTASPWAFRKGPFR